MCVWVCFHCISSTFGVIVVSFPYDSMHGLVSGWQCIVQSTVPNSKNFSNSHFHILEPEKAFLDDLLLYLEKSLNTRLRKNACEILTCIYILIYFRLLRSNAFQCNSPSVLFLCPVRFCWHFREVLNHMYNPFEDIIVLLSML